MVFAISRFGALQLTPQLLNALEEVAGNTLRVILDSALSRATAGERETIRNSFHVALDTLMRHGIIQLVPLRVESAHQQDDRRDSQGTMETSAVLAYPLEFCHSSPRRSSVKAHQSRITLSPNIGIEVNYNDASRFGGAASPKLQQNLRRLFRPVYRALERHGPQYVVRNGDKLLRQLFGNGAMSELYDRRGRMSSSVLYPNPRKIEPAAVLLSSEDGGREFRIPVVRRSLPEIHDIFAELASGEGASSPSARAIARGTDATISDSRRALPYKRYFRRGCGRRVRGTQHYRVTFQDHAGNCGPLVCANFEQLSGRLPADYPT